MTSKVVQTSLQEDWAPAWLDGNYRELYYYKGEGEGDATRVFRHRDTRAAVFFYTVEGGCFMFTLWSEVGQLVRHRFDRFWMQYLITGSVNSEEDPFVSDVVERREKKLDRTTPISDSIIYAQSDR